MIEERQVSPPGFAGCLAPRQPEGEPVTASEDPDAFADGSGDGFTVVGRAIVPEDELPTRKGLGGEAAEGL